MGRNEELMKSIGCHGQWKMRLRNAISTGQLDRPVAVIKATSECDLGKWLASYAPTDPVQEQHQKTVSSLHAEFHAAAAKAAELVEAGKHREAESLLNDTGAFTVASTKLTHAIMDWKNS